MRLNIWDKAKKDTIGSKAYYNNNKENYKWAKRIDADIISSSQEAMIKVASTMLASGKSIDEVKNALNEEGKINIIASSGKYELEDQNLPEGFNVVQGISDAYAQNGNFVVVNVKEIIAPSIKTFDEVKGRVISDYQKQLEVDWMEELRGKHTVVINKKVLKKIKKKFD